jgi:hypothetical protein
MESICGVIVCEHDKNYVPYHASIDTFLADILGVSPVGAGGEGREFGDCFTDDDCYFDSEHDYSTSVWDSDATIWFLIKQYDFSWEVSIKCNYNVAELPPVEDEFDRLFRVFVIHPLPLSAEYLHEKHPPPNIEITVEGWQDDISYQELVGWTDGS